MSTKCDTFCIRRCAPAISRTAWATTLMKGYLAPNGCAVSAQNGINDETIARIIGYERAIGCTISTITVALDRPGHVVRGGHSGRERGYDIFRVGELNGVVSPRVERIAAMLDGAQLVVLDGCGHDAPHAHAARFAHEVVGPLVVAAGSPWHA